MSQDGLFFFDNANTAQGGPRLIRVSAANPLPVSTSAGGGNQNVNLNQVGGSPIALGAVTTSASAIPVTIAQDVTMPITGSVIATFGAGSNVIGKVGIDQTTPGTTNRVAANLDQVAGATISQGHGTAATAIRVELPTDGTGVVGLNAGTAVVGKVGIDQTTPGTTNAIVALPSVNSGGLTALTQLIPSGAPAAVLVKNGAGNLYGIAAYNNSANIAYIHVYNSTAATVGTTASIDQHMIPGPSGGGGGGLIWNNTLGLYFTAGISFGVTGGIGGSDTTAVAANTYTVTFYYK